MTATELDRRDPDPDPNPQETNRQPNGMARMVGALIGVGRITFGLWALLAPGSLTKVTGNGATSAEQAGRLNSVWRLFGIRDVVLGIGALTAILNRSPAAKGWIAAGAAADTADVAMAAITRAEMGAAATATTIGIATSAAIPGWYAASQIDR